VAQEKLPTEYLAGVAEEDFGERELAGRQPDGSRADRQPAGAQVEPRDADVESCTPGTMAFAEAGPNPGKELIEAKRLRQVVVSALREECPHVAVAPTGEDDDREGPASRAQVHKYIEPVETGQADVQDEQVELAAVRQPERVSAVRCVDGGETIRAETLIEERSDPGLSSATRIRLLARPSATVNGRVRSSVAGAPAGRSVGAIGCPSPGIRPGAESSIEAILRAPPPRTDEAGIRGSSPIGA
jgi:hypothetical protein